MNLHIFNKLNKLIQLSENKEHSDKFIQQIFFKEQRNLGSHDRRTIKPIYFKIVRHYFLIKNILNSVLNIEKPSSEDYIFFTLCNDELMNEKLKSYKIRYDPHLVLPENLHLENIPQIAKELGKDIENYNLNNHFTTINEILDSNKIDITFSLNNLFANKLSNICTEKGYNRNIFISAFNSEAETTIRLVQGANPVNLETELNNANIKFLYGNFNKNHCLRILDRANINLINMSKSPLFEIQDEGSQLISLYMNPSPNEKILDYCAGAGGKTLHIADLINDIGLVIASDEDLSRTKELFKRKSKFNYKSIQIESKKNIEKKYKYYFDKILVDAPCSGSGTLRRDPHLKYKITEKEVSKRAKIQLEILNEVKTFVKTGGEITYSTCSVFADENEDVVNKFISENPNFELILPDNEFLEKYSIPNDQVGIGINLYPHNGTDGFFMCKLRKQ